MRLYIIRHADPNYELDTITLEGHLEARALAERMAKENLTHIYCSPLGRAIATCKYTAEKTGLTPIIEKWSCEVPDCFIEREPWGKISAWDTPGELIRENTPWPSHIDWHRIDPKGALHINRKFTEIATCSDQFFARHGYVRDAGRYRIEKSNRERIALFCHNGLALFWLSHLLEIPLGLMWSGFWHAPTSVTTILFDERSEKWAVPRALCVGDCSHLYAANLPVRPRGIITNYD
jgi:broad specificity phosphatase PhoE